MKTIKSYSNGCIYIEAKSTELNKLPTSGISQCSYCKMIDNDTFYRFYFDEDGIGRWNKYNNREIKSNSTQTTDAVSEKLKNITNPSVNKGAIFSFVDDDGKRYFIDDGFKKIFDKYNIKPTLGIITDFVGEKEYLTLEQLKSLDAEGYDIVSHTKTHAREIYQDTASNDLSGVTNEQLVTEFSVSQEFIKDNKFNSEVLIYPYGSFGQQRLRYKNIARNYYKYAFSALKNDTIKYNDSPIDNMFVKRYMLDITEDFTTVVKPIIDSCIANNGWLVFFMHSYESSQVTTSYLETVIQYLVSKQSNILNLKEALKIRGNSLSIGEYTSTNCFFVGMDGRSKKSNASDYKVATITSSNSKLILNNDQTNELIEKNSSVSGSIAITCETKDFSYAWKTYIVRVTGVTPPKKQISCIGTVITGSGSIVQCFPLIVPESDGFSMYMQDSHSATDIRFMLITNICYNV